MKPYLLCHVLLIILFYLQRDNNLAANFINSKWYRLMYSSIIIIGFCYERKGCSGNSYRNEKTIFRILLCFMVNNINSTRNTHY